MSKPDVIFYLTLDVKNGNNFYETYFSTSFMELSVLYLLFEIER
jgi:hypothetical protein